MRPSDYLELFVHSIACFACLTVAVGLVCDCLIATDHRVREREFDMSKENVEDFGASDCSSALFRLRLIHDQRFRVGQTSFEMAEGSVVSVVQVDPVESRLLVDFGDGLIDWISRERARCFDKVMDDGKKSVS